MTNALVRAWARGGMPLAIWALAVAVAGVLAAPTGAGAKTPGKPYCFNSVCHTGKTLDETRVNRVRFERLRPDLVDAEIGNQHSKS